MVRSGKYARDIANELRVSLPYVYNIARAAGLKLTTPPPWNKGLTEVEHSSIGIYSQHTRQRMTTEQERQKRANKNREMWMNGQFRSANVVQLADARAKWVQKIQSMSKADRKITLASFVEAGNRAQAVIRARHLNDVEWFKHKYPWASDPILVECDKCSTKFIQTINRRRSCGLNFCSPRCWLLYRQQITHPNYIINPTLAARIKPIACRQCKIPFLSVDSKWSKKFCCTACSKKWLSEHPNYTIKRSYFSAYFGQLYSYDSSYELDFIFWCERFKSISLIRNRPIVPYSGHRYFCDFLLDDTLMIEIKASASAIYDVQRECSKIRAAIEYAATNRYVFKLITERELYHNKCIDDETLRHVIDTQTTFIGEPWKSLI